MVNFPFFSESLFLKVAELLLVSMESARLTGLTQHKATFHVSYNLRRRINNLGWDCKSSQTQDISLAIRRTLGRSCLNITTKFCNKEKTPWSVESKHSYFLKCAYFVLSLSPNIYTVHKIWSYTKLSHTDCGLSCRSGYSATFQGLGLHHLRLLRSEIHLVRNRGIDMNRIPCCTPELLLLPSDATSPGKET